jgi:hypothetical protein
MRRAPVFAICVSRVASGWSFLHIAPKSFNPSSGCRSGWCGSPQHFKPSSLHAIEASCTDASLKQNSFHDAGAPCRLLSYVIIRFIT